MARIQKWFQNYREQHNWLLLLTPLNFLLFSVASVGHSNEGESVSFSVNSTGTGTWLLRPTDASLTDGGIQYGGALQTPGTGSDRRVRERVSSISNRRKRHVEQEYFHIIWYDFGKTNHICFGDFCLDFDAFEWSVIIWQRSYLAASFPAKTMQAVGLWISLIWLVSVPTWNTTSCLLHVYMSNCLIIST